MSFKQNKTVAQQDASTAGSSHQNINPLNEETSKPDDPVMRKEIDIAIAVADTVKPTDEEI